MRVRAKKSAAPAVPSEVPGTDRTALTDAYRAGLILGWRLDAEHGYCLMLAGRTDAYVGANGLMKYLQALRAS